MIKRIIKKKPWLHLILKVYRNRKNCNYVNNLLNFDDNSNIVFLEKNENFDVKETVCSVEVNGKNEGFCASIRWILDGLYFCDYYSLKPVIKFGKNSLYYDSAYGKDDDPFDYYYKQPSLLNLEKNNIPSTVIKIARRNFLLAENLNGGPSYKYSNEYINNMALIMKKYLDFNDEIKEKINNSLIERNISSNILGVHIRGTDYKKNYKNHPVYIETEHYYQYIDKALKEFKFKKIFLATDDNEVLDKMLEHYGKDMIIYDEKTLRNDGIIGVHTNKSKRKYNNYMNGLEVIIDMCSLAACGGIISGMSQVGLIARIYKKSKNEEFIYNEILSKGINKKGKVFKA